MSTKRSRGAEYLASAFEYGRIADVLLWGAAAALALLLTFLYANWPQSLSFGPQGPNLSRVGSSLLATVGVGIGVASLMIFPSRLGREAGGAQGRKVPRRRQAMVESRTFLAASLLSLALLALVTSIVLYH
ncbi:MAG: hypothetical protein ABWK00_00965 [Desulfurococcaceae archaeon]